MEGISSKSNSSRSCSFRRPSLASLAVLALVLCAGCSEWTRFAPPQTAKAFPRPGGTDPRFRVVDCTLETHKGASPFMEDAIGVSGQSVPGLQAGLRKAAPDWFSNDAGAIPLVVKVRAEGTGFYAPSSCVGVIPSLLTLCVLPDTSVAVFDMAVSIQLGPGEWSHAKLTTQKEEMLTANWLTQLLFPPIAAPEKGWQKDSPMYPRGTLLPYMKGGIGAGGMNPVFATALAGEIVDVWNGLTPSEKRRAVRNPVAIKKHRERHPETETAEGSSETAVAVPSAGAAEALEASVSVPTVVGCAYFETSRRGFVVFRKNGTEHLAALRWVHQEAIPKIAGKGALVRILSEKTLENGDSRIDFEVVQ